MNPLHRPTPSAQRGAVAIMVAVSLLVLLGMFGLAVDSGRLYINKAELQSAADACALAAAQELTCQSGAGTGVATCPANFLQRAEAAGIFAGGRNRAQLQGPAVSIAAADVRFSTALGPNSGYVSRTAGASVNSRFAMCIARANGIVPWVMGVVGAGANDVNAVGVATLAPGQTFCSNAPLGVCRKAGGAAPNFGYTVGEWITAQFTTNGNNNDAVTDVTGGFKWVDFTPNAGGTNELREQLYGREQVCGLKVGDNIREPGVKQGSKLAYNTRFGIYANASGETAATAPPDLTGYAYPNKAPGSPVIGVGTSAYADFIARRITNKVFVPAELNMPGNVVVGQDAVASLNDYRTYGADRRLMAVPVIGCASNTEPILGMACVLLLNPMSKGNGNGNLYIEFRGNASNASSPCRTTGGAGGPGGGGALVPTLVQ